MSINTVTVSGHLTSTIELKATNTGLSVLEFCVVCDERKRDAKSGEWVSVPNFFNCVAFGNRAEALHKILEKGMKVAVFGHLRYEAWEKDGQKRSTINIIAEDIEIFSRRNGVEQQNTTTQGNYASGYENAYSSASGGVSEYAERFEGEGIPF